MSSPFPGMDPYLEASHIWEDFHASLAMEIRNQLAPGLRPRYIAALIPAVTYDEVLVEKVHRAKPDVSVWQVDEQPWCGEAVAIDRPLSSATSCSKSRLNYTVLKFARPRLACW